MWPPAPSRRVVCAALSNTGGCGHPPLRFRHRHTLVRRPWKSVEGDAPGRLLLPCGAIPLLPTSLRPYQMAPFCLAGGGGRLCPAGGASAGGVRTGGSPGDGAGGGRQALLSGGAGAALQCEPQRGPGPLRRGGGPPGGGRGGAAPPPPLARYVCSEAESAWLERQGGDWGAFYTLWTLKEARVKCTGEGLRRPPRDIAVPLLRPGETGELDGLVFSAFSGETWRAAACCPTPQGPLELFVRNS